MAKVEERTLEEFRPQRINANKHTQRGLGALEAAMRRHGFIAPITAAADGEIIDGSARIETAANVFDEDVLVVEHDGTKPIIMVRTDIASADTKEARAIGYEANRIAQLNLVWDAEVLLGDKELIQEMKHLFDDEELAVMLGGLLNPPEPTPGEVQAAARLSLAERFIIPPFSVLDARQGYWQERKRHWIALGIQSELGRGEDLGGLSAETEDYRADKQGYAARLASPGGSARPATKLGKDGKTRRGDGAGKALEAKGLTWNTTTDPAWSERTAGRAKRKKGAADA
jgi:hypothetical protein